MEPMCRHWQTKYQILNDQRHRQEQSAVDGFASTGTAPTTVGRQCAPPPPCSCSLPVFLNQTVLWPCRPRSFRGTGLQEEALSLSRTTTLNQSRTLTLTLPLTLSFYLCNIFHSNNPHPHSHDPLHPSFEPTDPVGGSAMESSSTPWLAVACAAIPICSRNAWAGPASVSPQQHA